MPRAKILGEKPYDTSDTTERCSQDMRLRKYGFHIKRRPENGPVLWEKFDAEACRWVEYTEERAHQYADRQEKLEALK